MVYRGTRVPKKKKKLSCYDIADYFLAQMDEDAGDLISNLKLQKLVYYAQGFHLALYNKPLFTEKIEAWIHGAVIPDLYHQFKDYGPMPLPRPKNLDFSIFSDQVKELLDEVYAVYGQYSAWRLREMVHSEAPWKNAYKRHDDTIANEEMKTYFKKYLKK